jgi:drug/metabolite transporter (DMT)-like permease
MYRIWLAGFFAMALPWYLLFWGERFISPALAGIINGTVPLWVILLNFFYNRKSQRPTPAQIMGLMLGFFGVATIFAPKLKVSYSSQEFFGIVAVTLMAISYAVSGRLTSRILSGESKVSPFANIFHQILSSFVLVSIGAVLLESPWKQSFSDYRSVVSVIYLGIGSSALAYFLIYRLIPIWGLVRASTANYIVPIFSILFQILIYKETPSLSELSGVSLIISGLFLANFSQLKKPA